ncbi:MAG: indolepyruvate ferredoxin oxidoreductase family protein, partial [Pseudomonadota bacterium]
RGSPLSGYDQRLLKAKGLLEAHDIHFQPGVNEDLAATAVWGSQQVCLHPGARTEGVFGLWYGKAPGVDRTGDVFKHANMSGTWAKGGVLAVAGDDPLAKSSSLPNQSEFAFIDAEIPILTPSSVQDVLDLGLHGLALSRYSGLWTGLIALADLMDGSATISVEPTRFTICVPPDDAQPRHISLDALQVPNRMALEETLRDLRMPAALRYARANKLNRVIAGLGNARIGVVSSGKSWSALMSAFDLLGLDLRDAERLGLRVMKVSMPWPLEPEGIREFASNLDTVLVVEGKRSLIEAQIKNQLYHLPADRRPAVIGKTDPLGETIFSETGDLDATTIASGLLRLLPTNEETASMSQRLDQVKVRQNRHRQLASPSVRTPHFCSGCPHSRSTRIPEGSRAMAGIGCHIMTQWTRLPEKGHDSAEVAPAEGYSQMGGEGAAWIGQAPFTKTEHVFVNLGDGTYHHSGLLAIRAAVAADVSVTYKILYNDAVAMTGGQSVDGPLSVEQIVSQLHAEGVSRIVVASETPQRFRHDLFPSAVSLVDRSELNTAQRELRKVKGVSVLIFDQTCAAEKRRRRKRGLAPRSEKQVLIHDRVCEGCGDCSRQSNCLSVEPLETAFGTKRRINQSSCNQDLSCTDGFCPSFVTIEGGERQRPEPPIQDILTEAAKLPKPDAGGSITAVSVLLPGNGGTGVTTISAVLAMAAHLDGRHVASTDMTGLAQKGGAVLSYLRFGPDDRSLAGGKILPGGADLVIGCDLMVSASTTCLELCSPDRTSVIADRTVAPSGAFALFQDAMPSSGDLATRLSRVSKSVEIIDAGDLAEMLFGDRIFSNMILVGAAFQSGKLPISAESIDKAITLNGAARDFNKAAFHAGRILFAAPDRLATERSDPKSADDATLEELVALLGDELKAYQNTALADRFRSVVARVRFAETGLGDSRFLFSRAVAKNLFKLMAYKDEYEVARLYADPAFKRRIRDEFGTHAKISIQLAPPLLSRIDPTTARPKKRHFGPWIFAVFTVLARFKGLRGTWADPFGWTAERRMERALIEDYLSLIDRLLPALSDDSYQIALSLASLPESISGFGPVKAAKVATMKTKEAELLARFQRMSVEATPLNEFAFAVAAE